jgi:folate-dependent phosphoribosylglycinamide formyltransferase PurN
VSHKKSILILMAALSVVVLAGFMTVSLSADTLSAWPNDKANHHPRSVNG